MNDLREAINEARYQRQVLASKQFTDLDQQKDLEDLVITVNSKCSSSSNAILHKEEISNYEEKFKNTTIKMESGTDLKPSSTSFSDLNHNLAKKIKQEVTDVINIKTEPKENDDDCNCFSETDVCIPTIKKEFSYSNKNKTFMSPLLKGHFGVRLSAVALQAKATLKFNSLQQNFHLFNMEFSKLVCSFTLDRRPKPYFMETHHSFLPSKLSCTLGYGIKDLPFKFIRWNQIDKFIRFQKQNDFHKITSLTNWKNFAISCSKKQIFSRQLELIYERIEKSFEVKSILIEENAQNGKMCKNNIPEIDLTDSEFSPIQVFQLKKIPINVQLKEKVSKLKATEHIEEPLRKKLKSISTHETSQAPDSNVLCNAVKDSKSGKSNLNSAKCSMQQKGIKLSPNKQPNYNKQDSHGSKSFLNFFKNIK